MAYNVHIRQRRPTIEILTTLDMFQNIGTKIKLMHTSNVYHNQTGIIVQILLNNNKQVWSSVIWFRCLDPRTCGNVDKFIYNWACISKSRSLSSSDKWQPLIKRTYKYLMRRYLGQNIIWDTINKMAFSSLLKYC